MPFPNFYLMSSNVQCRSMLLFTTFSLIHHQSAQTPHLINLAKFLKVYSFCESPITPSTTHLLESLSLFAQGVLVDGQYILVLQQSLGFSTDVPQVHRHNEGRGHDGPHCHLNLLLTITQAIITND